MSYKEAKCTNCGGELMLDEEMKTGFCNHCGSKIIIKDAIQRVKIDEPIIVEGLQSLERRFKNVMDLLDMGLFEDSKQLLQELIKETPRDYRVWWGLYRAHSMNGEAIKDYYTCDNYIKRAIELSDETEKKKIMTEHMRYNTLYSKSKTKEKIIQKKSIIVATIDNSISKTMRDIELLEKRKDGVKNNIKNLESDRNTFVKFGGIMMVVILLFIVFLLVGSNEGLWFTIRSWGFFITLILAIVLGIIGFKSEIFQCGVESFGSLAEAKKQYKHINEELRRNNDRIMKDRDELSKKKTEYDAKISEI